MFCISGLSFSQTNFAELIPQVVQDIEKFGNAYIEPASEAAMFNVNSGWYTSAEAKTFPQFEISVLSNVTYVPNSGGDFELDPLAYNSVRFEDGYQPKNVASIFGSDKDLSVFIDYETDEGLQSLEIELPPGVDNGDVNVLPTFFVQGSLGLIKGTEVKFRYSPELAIGDISTEIVGVALQHEFTSWLKQEDFFVNLSGLVAYSSFKGTYYIEDEEPNNEASIVSDMDAWSFSLIASKNLAKFTFFGGLDYSMATSVSHFQGVYTMPEQGEQFQNVLNQIEIENKDYGFSGSLGLNYQINHIKTQLMLNLQKYSNISIGVGYCSGE